MLKEAVPGMVRVACTMPRNPENPNWVRIADAARVLGLEIVDIAVQGPDDIEHFFVAARREGADAVLVHNAAWFGPLLTRFGELAAQSRLPAIGVDRRFAEAGGCFLTGGPRWGEWETSPVPPSR